MLSIPFQRATVGVYMQYSNIPLISLCSEWAWAWNVTRSVCVSYLRGINCDKHKPLFYQKCTDSIVTLTSHENAAFEVRWNQQYWSSTISDEWDTFSCQGRRIYCCLLITWLPSGSDRPRPFEWRTSNNFKQSNYLPQGLLPSNGVSQLMLWTVILTCLHFVWEETILKLLYLYKLVNGYVSSSCGLLVLHPNPNLRVSHEKLVQPFARTSALFFISSVRAWNSLPPDIYSIIVLVLLKMF